MKAKRTRRVLVSFTEIEWFELARAMGGIPAAIWVRLAALEKARARGDRSPPEN